MDRILTYTIKPEQEGMQLLDFLRSKGFSRGILSSMKADKNAIQLNGERGFGKSILPIWQLYRESHQSKELLMRLSGAQQIPPSKDRWISQMGKVRSHTMSD